MIVEELSKTRAAEQFETMLAKGFKPIALKNPELKTISKELTRLMMDEAAGKSPYQQDLLYGRELFRVLSNASWFNWYRHQRRFLAFPLCLRHPKCCL